MGRVADGRRRHGKKKPQEERLSIEACLGFALGVVGLRLDDFCRLTPEEFHATCRAYHEAEDARRQGEWERMRTLATISIQPHVKRTLTPEKLLPLPWDQVRKTAEAKPVSKEESRRRFERLAGCAGSAAYQDRRRGGCRGARHAQDRLMA